MYVYSNSLKEISRNNIIKVEEFSEYDVKEDLIKIIKQAKEKIIGINFNENKFIKDLINAVPIFVKEGNEYRWAHKSFQEYFAAMYISYDSKNNQSAILNKISEKDKIQKYYNVLDFCYDIDYKKFIRVLVFPVLKLMIWLILI